MRIPKTLPLSSSEARCIAKGIKTWQAVLVIPTAILKKYNQFIFGENPVPISAKAASKCIQINKPRLANISPKGTMKNKPNPYPICEQIFTNEADSSDTLKYLENSPSKGWQ